ncbi:unnamed protein product [Tuber melanosporum]|uniref:(Perigord truffle) hypothetical protein n=1 Tax=Tuber melanosporum (strain Mel28) TaxID=656061 RepID=D5G7I1_TUBMM|nr:uncharacterized protein GSTUM_00002475001 [Tuber melanosporum]CAZ80474.1 unnamed protein product [Tuber melanosporum]
MLSEPSMPSLHHGPDAKPSFGKPLTSLPALHLPPSSLLLPSSVIFPLPSLPLPCAPVFPHHAKERSCSICCREASRGCFPEVRYNN